MGWIKTLGEVLERFSGDWLFERPDHALKITGRLVFVFLMSVVLASCAARGKIAYVEGGDDGLIQSGLGTEHTIYLATSRALADTSELEFGPTRSADVKYARYKISVPPNHEVGRIEWAQGNADPKKHFVTTSSDNLSREESFVASINQSLSKRPPTQQDIIVFVHGYNTNFSEGLYRFTQMVHDYQATEVAVHYSWPSAGKLSDYVYDRDSTSFSRDGLEQLLEGLAKTNARKIIVAAHSLGSYLTVETLRQLSIKGSRRFERKLSSVVLLSPDIDEDVFVQQATRIDPFPKSFIILTSQNDSALKFSSFLSGELRRLGSIQDTKRLENIGVTLIDLSDVDDGDDLNHLSAGTSPSAIAMLKNFPISRARSTIFRIGNGRLVRVQSGGAINAGDENLGR